MTASLAAAAPSWNPFFFAGAALAILFQIWRGWRAGIVRQLLGLGALLVAYLAAYLGGKLAVPPFRGTGLPDIVIQILAGGIIGTLVFVALSIMSALLFKRTADQGSRFIRFAYGLGGAAIGAVLGLVTVLVAILAVRLLGSVAETINERPAKGRGRASGPQAAVIEGLGGMKKSLEQGRVGAVIEQIDPIPTTVYAVLGKMGRALHTPERAARFLEFPGARALVQHPRLAALRDDPAIAEHLRERSYLPLLRNEHIVAAANDPELLPLLQDFELEKALDYALAAPEKKKVLSLNHFVMAIPYLTTIGLEVHVQLRTRSKMFCGCPVEFGAGPNAHTCPVCLGLPGALPVINARAVELTTLTGLMLGCAIPPISKWDRKNYFYPDMPKNYQISQFDLPLCLGGAVPLPDYAYPRDAQKSLSGPGRQIGLVRIHLEEDVAKSFHFESSTGIDFNRAGTPLMEIVSEPEIRTPEEAFAFLSSLRQILVYGGVSDADMEKGQLRCDCNVSVRPEGQDELGTKIEIKNMNSISGVRRALAFEIERQTAAYRRGETLQQETRRWDDASGETYLMRTKESAHDYRYFPDPDLLPVRTETITARMREQLPELPSAKRERFVEHYGISPYDAGVLASDLSLARYFETAATGVAKPKAIANWILNDLLNALSTTECSLDECRVPPDALAELVALAESGQINQGQAREVFAEMLAHGRRAAAIVAEKGLAQESDTGAIETLCDQVIAANPKVVADYRAGKSTSINFLKGQVMKLSGGKANPAVASEVLARRLGPG